MKTIRTLLVLLPMAAAVAYIATLGTFHGLRWSLVTSGAVTVMSILALAHYGLDKRRAIRGGRRTPEFVLLGLVALGGAAGALAAQRLLHHKTSKRSFQIALWAIIGVQFAVAILMRVEAGWPNPWTS